MLKIHASLLNADFQKLDAEIASVERSVDGIHFDVMDGKFVPNMTPLTPEVLKNMHTKLPVEVHLMVEHPEEHIPDFIEAEPAYIAFHYEGTDKVEECLTTIRNANIKAGLVLSPDTPISVVNPFLDLLDYVLIMSVQPGFGKQKFMPEALKKVTALKQARPDITVIIDGGINPSTVEKASQAGADIVVCGSYIFKAANRREAIQKLRGELE